MNPVFLLPYSKSETISQGKKGYSQCRVGQFQQIGSQQKVISTFLLFEDKWIDLVQELIKDQKTLSDFYAVTVPYAKFMAQESIFVRYTTEDKIADEFGWQEVKTKEGKSTLIDGKKLHKKYFLQSSSPSIGWSWEDLSHLTAKIEKV